MHQILKWQILDQCCIVQSLMLLSTAGSQKVAGVEWLVPKSEQTFPICNLYCSVWVCVIKFLDGVPARGVPEKLWGSRKIELHWRVLNLFLFTLISIMCA